MDGADLVNTCTTKTKNKVEEILSNLNSNEKKICNFRKMGISQYKI